MITAQDAADSLRLLLPGFVALNVFYVFGHRTKRSDLEWTLWSVLVAALIDPLVDQAGSLVPLLGELPRILVAGGVAIAFGLVLAGGWLLLAREVPTVRQRASRMAWDAVLTRPHWVQVWTTDGKTISGKVTLLADRLSRTISTCT